jgi:hypothetical protein
MQMERALLRLFLRQLECATILAALLPRPVRVAGLAKMFVDNLLILRNGRVVAPPAETMREASHPSKQ